MKLFHTLQVAAARLLCILAVVFMSYALLSQVGVPVGPGVVTVQKAFIGSLIFAMLALFGFAAGVEVRAQRVALLVEQRNELLRLYNAAKLALDRSRTVESAGIDRLARHEFTGAQLDTLIGLIERGPLDDGSVPSKTGRDELIVLGLARRVIVKGEDGYTAATYAGRDAYKARYGADGENLWRCIQNRKAGTGTPAKQLVNICGVDCKPGDGECNGYCTGQAECAKRYDGPARSPRFPTGGRNVQTA